MSDPVRSPADTVAALTPQRLGRIRMLLLDWYEEHGDDFPWRSRRDPYAALVAAVCSQQTQIARVLVLYEGWMAAFPTVEAAAGATRERVLRVWGRGGFPRRSVALHEASRICLLEHDGALPRDPEALLALPGVGPFTAAIVRCYGFGEDAVAVDTNIVRVIGRLVFGDLQPATETPPAAIELAAARLLRPGTAARWNPALMEYGAKVCSPRPRCLSCPVGHLCAARPRFLAGEAAEPVRAQPAFEGSNRQWRGRILRELRAPANEGGMRVATLAARLASEDSERGRVRRLLLALRDDGLAWSRAGRCGLGEPPER
jgi:A/G-specific adenine glycosylase